MTDPTKFGAFADMLLGNLSAAAKAHQKRRDLLEAILEVHDLGTCTAEVAEGVVELFGGDHAAAATKIEHLRKVMDVMFSQWLRAIQLDRQERNRSRK